MSIYRPVYSLVLGTKIMIVLTSPQAIKDLLEKRSNIHSSRPDMYLMNVLSDDLRMIGMVSPPPPFFLTLPLAIYVWLFFYTHNTV